MHLCQSIVCGTRDCARRTLQLPSVAQAHLQVDKDAWFGHHASPQPHMASAGPLVVDNVHERADIFPDELDAARDV